MKRFSTIASAMLASAAILSMAMPVSAGATKTCPTGSWDGDVRVKGRCVIVAGATVTGDVQVTNGNLRVEGTILGNAKVRNGTLVIIGTVEGNVRQEDRNGERGHVYVYDAGHVGGNIIEKQRGRLHLVDTAEPGAPSVDGYLREYDEGFLWVAGESTVGGYVYSPPEPDYQNEPGKDYCRIENPDNIGGELLYACAEGWYDV